MAVENDKGGPTVRLAEDLEGLLDAIGIVGIADPQNIPSVTEEPGRNVLREGNARVAFDGDVIVVVHPAEVVESQMGGQRRSFRGDPLHHAAISADSIDFVIEDIESG